MQGFPISSPTFEILLGSAWNQVGHHNAANVNWKDVQFRQGIITKSLMDASAAGWISLYLHNYNPAAGLYETHGSADGVLNPGKGYWIKANQPGITMIIPSP